ncbi:MAG: DnaJ domain-containing protein [Elusimicrobia bacterium]|nr:DnaJ domain-containing protein [Elusimicrobiota bacterium]
MTPDPALRRAGVWLLAGLLYLLWPWDVVPDFMVVIGWVDDLLIAGFAVYMAYKRFEGYAARGPGRARPAVEPGDVDPYEVLGVDRGATPEAVKAAYKARMAEYHPDKVAHLGADLKALADKKAKAIQKAYERLSG